MYCLVQRTVSVPSVSVFKCVCVYIYIMGDVSTVYLLVAEWHLQILLQIASVHNQLPVKECILISSDTEFSV